MATITFKCPNCGGGLQFDPASQKYKCEYCLSLFSQEELQNLQAMQNTQNVQDMQNTQNMQNLQAMQDTQNLQAMQNEQAMQDMQNEQGEAGGKQTADAAGRPKGASAQAVIYTCPSCGAEIVTDETTAATFCFYCHNPVVLEGRLDGAYEPDYVLPFEVDRAKAREIFLRWLKKKRFVPKSFYSEEQIEKMTGVYFPYWMYSCQVDGHLEAIGTRQTRTWVQGSTRYTENKKYNVVRNGRMNVDRVTRNALKKADRKLVEGVMPYELGKIKPFSMGYLSGFMAEKRDIEHEEYEREVEEEVRSYAASSLASGVDGYSNLQVQSRQIDLKNARWDYALMPVWTLTYKDGASGQIYYFACNGQTGKVCGKLPIDKVKLGIFFAEIFAPLFAVLLIVGYLL